MRRSVKKAKKRTMEMKRIYPKRLLNKRPFIKVAKQKHHQALSVTIFRDLT